ncbi:MAG: hypothetical protein PHQ86_04205 [Dehalococcoidales bacterium]|nr:hypothetical protein [Dehalococcoidales bacterium]
MKKTRKPIIGGILAIFSGALGLLGIINYAVGLSDISGLSKGDMPPFVPSIIFEMPVPSIIIAVLALVGGVFAITRKRWRWALTGAISATLSLILLGIPALIMIAISKDEFK